MLLVKVPRVIAWLLVAAIVVAMAGSFLTYSLIWGWHLYIHDKQREWGSRSIAQAALLTPSCQKEVGLERKMTTPELVVRPSSELRALMKNLYSIVWDSRSVTYRRAYLSQACQENLKRTYKSHEETSSTLTVFY